MKKTDDSKIKRFSFARIDRDSTVYKLINPECRKIIKCVVILISILLVLLAAIFHKYSSYAWLMKSAVFCQIYQLVSENIVSIYLAQLSLTFISISVMSMLSDDSITIYWENIAKRKLVFPMWSSFFAYTAYSMASLAVGGIATIFEYHILFVIAFVFDVVCLGKLTFSMLDVYFGTETAKEELSNEFLTLIDGTCRLNRSAIEKKRIEIRDNLLSNTLVAFQNKDIQTVKDNLLFYGKYITWFSPEEITSIVAMDDMIFSPLIIQFINDIFTYEEAKMQDAISDSQGGGNAKKARIPFAKTGKKNHYDRMNENMTFGRILESVFSEANYNKITEYCRESDEISIWSNMKRYMCFLKYVNENGVSVKKIITRKNAVIVPTYGSYKKDIHSVLKSLDFLATHIEKKYSGNEYMCAEFAKAFSDSYYDFFFDRNSDEQNEFPLLMERLMIENGVKKQNHSESQKLPRMPFMRR